jgi:hypothetical protein
MKLKEMLLREVLSQVESIMYLPLEVIKGVVPSMSQV